MKQYRLKLKDSHLRNLAMGKGIMISPKMAMGEGYAISMSPAKHARLSSAHSKGKSSKLTLSKKELMANGVEMMEGGRIRWRDIGRTLRKVGEKAGKFYREVIRPEVGPALKRLVKRGVEEGLPAVVEGLTTIAGIPEAGVVAQPFVRGYAQRISEPVAQAISRKTGAFGTKKKKTVRRKTAPKAQGSAMDMPIPSEVVQPSHPKFALNDTYWNFIMPNHPAFSPPLPYQSINDGMVGMPDLRSRMYFKKGGAMLSGLPMEPVLPPSDNSGYHTQYL